MAEPDFIIIGAGSAGCVLADRLSADGRFKVAVLEAGGSDDRFFVRMPLGYGRTFHDPSLNWGFQAEPDPGLGGRRDYWPRGKVLGGSSSINAMVWIRGSAADFDDWEKAGNPGWGWSDMLPAFKAIETCQAGDARWRGKTGPMQIASQQNALHPLASRFVKAGIQAGLKFNIDFNGERQEGIGYYQITAKNGRRWSAASAFLHPALKRQNVELIAHAHVCRILFDGKTAIGVEYKKHGQTHILHCQKEVILSAGAVGSPQLLQLSGIGPGALLKAHGIAPIIANANVGKHLQDHLGPNYYFKSKVPTMNDALNSKWQKLLMAGQYLFGGYGPLSASLNQAGGFFKTAPRLSRPNMQLYFQAISTMQSRDAERPLLAPDPFSAFAIGLSNCRPKSTGTIKIASPDPFVSPKIHAGAFSGNEDLEEMLAGVRFIRKLASQPALADVIEEEILPGEKCKDRNALIEDLRRRIGTVYHPVSTCRMGPKANANVVDPQLKVHGVSGLTVIDASIFPNHISGNINAATIAIGWKGAELVLADYG